MHEIETKVLEVDVEAIKKKLEAFGAKKTQDVTLTVDWFSMPESKKDNQPWYLRVRSYSSGKVEVTWKGPYKIIGKTHQNKEINILIDDHKKMKELFESIGLIVYAHQEKKRVSWTLENVTFDLDTYPGMQSYLEIEANSEEEIEKMIKNMNLESHDTWSDGERTLIEDKYKLNWSDMRF